VVTEGIPENTLKVHKPKFEKKKLIEKVLLVDWKEVRWYHPKRDDVEDRGKFCLLQDAPK